jgi:hypothetical protein
MLGTGSNSYATVYDSLRQRRKKGKEKEKEKEKEEKEEKEEEKKRKKKKKGIAIYLVKTQAITTVIAAETRTTKVKQ